MKTFKISVHPTKWEAKPTTPRERGSLFNNYSYTELTLKELADKIDSGHTFCTAQLNNEHRLNKNFIESQVIMLDYDDGQDWISIVAKLKSKGIRTNLIYNSFSHTEEHPRFRLVIVLDNPLADPKYFKQILTSLINYTGADKNCKDISRMFFGGNAPIVLDNEFNQWEVVRQPITDLINADEKNGGRRSKNLQKSKSVSKTATPLYYKETAENETKIQIREFDFATAASTSSVFESFDSSTTDLSYSQLLNMTIEMQYVEGGIKYMKTKMRAWDDVVSSSDSTLQLKPYKPHDYQLLYSVPKYGYTSMSIESFDPELKDDFYSIKDLDNKTRQNITQLVKVEKEDVDVISERFKMQFNNAKHSVNRISFCKAAAGLGKTKIIITEPNVIIAVPNHKLKDELASRMVENGLDYVVTPPPPVFDCEELNLRRNELQAMGESRAASDLLHSIADGEEIEGIVYYSSDTDRAKDFFNKLEAAYNAECTVLTTHSRIMLTPQLFKNKETVIMDENPINELVKAKSVGYESLQRALDRVLNDSSLDIHLKDYVLAIKDKIDGAMDNKELSIATKYDEYEDELDEYLQLKKGVASLKALIDADKIFKSVYLGVVSYNYGSLEQFSDVFKKVIVVSADVSHTTFKRVLNEEFDFFHSGFVKNKKNIVQYNTKSYSKSSMNAKNFELPTVNHSTVLTYMSERGRFDTTQDHYYGNLIGIDKYKGKDISYVGTPIPPAGSTIIKALLLGHSVDNIEKGLNAAKTEFYQFPFFTFNDATLRAIELEDIERELVQALGRGRTIRESCNAELFSSFPVVEADVQEGKKLFATDNLLDIKTLSTKFEKKYSFEELFIKVAEVDGK